jgi:hypothetical protein
MQILQAQYTSLAILLLHLLAVHDFQAFSFLLSSQILPLLRRTRLSCFLTTLLLHQALTSLPLPLHHLLNLIHIRPHPLLNRHPLPTCHFDSLRKCLPLTIVIGDSTRLGFPTKSETTELLEAVFEKRFRV